MSMTAPHEIVPAATDLGGHAAPAKAAFRAMLLDDSDFDRKNIRRLSAKTGIPLDFVEAATMAEFEERLDEATYDLIFIDYRLPEGDGLQALERIKAHPAQQNTAVLMIAGLGGVDTAVTALRNGCHDYIEKRRLGVDVLRRAISEALDRRRGQRMTVPATTAAAPMVPVQRTTSPSLSVETRELVKQAVTEALAGVTMVNGRFEAATDAVFDNNYLQYLRQQETFIFN